jgi:hypothetical protein
MPVAVCRDWRKSERYLGQVFLAEREKKNPHTKRVARTAELPQQLKECDSPKVTGQLTALTVQIGALIWHETSAGSGLGRGEEFR